MLITIVALSFLLLVVVSLFVFKATSFRALQKQHTDLQSNCNLLEDAKNEFEQEYKKISQINNELLTQNQVLQEKIKFTQESIQRQEDAFKEQTKHLEERVKNAINENIPKASGDVVSQRVNEVINPFKVELNNMQAKIDDYYKTENTSSIKLSKHIEDMNKVTRENSLQVGDLTKALKGDNKIQGNFGELQCETLLNSLGFEKNIHYQTQVKLDGVGGRKYPDFIINLPKEQGKLVIDSKFVLTSYMAYTEAETKDEKEQALKDLKKAVTNHIKDLIDDKYHEHLQGQASCTLMFVSNKNVVNLMVEHGKDILERALHNKVFVVDATSLYGILHFIKNGYEIEKQDKNTQEIIKISKHLHEKLVEVLNEVEEMNKRFAKFYGTLSTKIEGNQGALKDIKKLDSFDNLTINESRLKLEQLGVEGTKEIKA